MHDSRVLKVLGFCGALVGCVTTVDREPPPPTGTGGNAVDGGGAGGRKGTGGTSGVDVAPPVVDAGSADVELPPAPGFLGMAAVSAKTLAPPISGGTLLVLADGDRAFAADPDRDALYFADLREEKLLSTLTLQAGDEPGRAVEDATGAVHVVLRGAGALASVNADRTLRERRPVCPAPRGIAFDPASSVLHVACAGGELLTLPAGGGAATRTLHLDRDLRDVVVKGDKLYVSVFRSAELLVLGPTGQVIERRRPPGSAAANTMFMTSEGARPMASPGVAWRLRPLPATALEDGVAMIHQEATNNELAPQPGGYNGGPCKTPIGAAVASFGVGSATSTGQMMTVNLPVDFAYSRDGKRVAVVAAGNANSFDRRPPVQVWSTAMFAKNPAPPPAGTSPGVAAPLPAPPIGGDCMFPGQGQPPPEEIVEFRQPVGEPTAIDFDGQGRIVVQTREPARIEILTHRGGTIKLSEESRFDSGHAVFHVTTNGGLACAACHPEGGDDGRVWRFAKIGVRRTQNLRGGIAQTAPFHWDGDMRDLDHLMSEVFTGRMSGPMVPTAHVSALGNWMGRLPALPASAPADDAAVARGKALFNDAKVACATCHNGPLLTNNQTVAVGTGKPFQVPTLKGIAARAPFMHDGCAATLAARFTAPCGGGDQHGVTSHLSQPQIADLVAYLESL